MTNKKCTEKADIKNTLLHYYIIKFRLLIILIYY